MRQCYNSIKVYYLAAVIIFILTVFPIGRCEAMSMNNSSGIIKLPAPYYDGNTSVEMALLKRRSIRSYSNEPLSLAEISQLLWAAQGITDSRGYRTTPSAGALYPLEIYIVAGRVKDLSQGIYKYRPHENTLVKIVDGDKRAEVCRASLNQSPISDAAAVIVFCAIYERTTVKYGERGIRYVFIEVGHAAQNIYLQAVSLKLGTLVIGAFNDNELKRIMKFDLYEYPLCIMPVGKLSSE
ncbi:MAG: SagB/ThcOx family dehydrogenase [Deltaproteobacteria bacterium]|nr:SagB/ThcOx family dehydrogenase [Deltaproteobacteria bacterium]